MVDNLDDPDFADMVDKAPLVSIDLVITRGDRVLLGFRKNAPAKGLWFVPGGRIKKNEDLAEAFLRITDEELRTPIPIGAAHFIGAYVHKYSDENFKGREHVDIHYVVLAYRLQLDIPLRSLPREQHSKYRWASLSSLLADRKVHTNTKMLFDNKPSGSATDSPTLHAHGDLLELYRGYQASINSYANVVWQFPIALVALNILAWANLSKNLYAMLLTVLLNYVFLQPLFKLVANQRSIIDVTRNIERSLRQDFNAPPDSPIVPTFSYSWPLSVKSGKLLPWSLLVLNTGVLGALILMLVKGAA